jgi:hypothetical protein
MPTLTYWVCHHLTDRSCYSYRARTRRECRAFLDGAVDPDDMDAHEPTEKLRQWRRENYSSSCKVTVSYENAFDLLCQCLSGATEEDASRWDAEKDADARDSE